MFLHCKEIMIVGSNVVLGKELYKVCVKAFNKKFLDNKCDTPWRNILNLAVDEKPQWRALYKSPLVKKKLGIYSGECYMVLLQ